MHQTIVNIFRNSSNTYSDESIYSLTNGKLCDKVVFFNCEDEVSFLLVTPLISDEDLSFDIFTHNYFTGYPSLDREDISYLVAASNNSSDILDPYISLFSSLDSVMVKPSYDVEDILKYTYWNNVLQQVGLIVYGEDSSSSVKEYTYLDLLAYRLEYKRLESISKLQQELDSLNTISFIKTN